MKNLYETLTSFVPFQRLDSAVTAVRAATDIVDLAEHNAAVKREVDWQHHWVDKFSTADAECHRLMRLIDLTSLRRVRKVLADLEQVPRQGAGAKHDANCWQRHAGCLARRIGDRLNGTEVPE